MRVVVESREASADQTILQLEIRIGQLPVGRFEPSDERFLFLLLTFLVGDVGNRVSDMHVTAHPLNWRPLEQHESVIRKRDSTAGPLSCCRGFRHLAELTRDRAAGDFLLAGLVGPVAEFFDRTRF